MSQGRAGRLSAVNVCVHLDAHRGQPATLHIKGQAPCEFHLQVSFLKGRAGLSGSNGEERPDHNRRGGVGMLGAGRL